ncbi:MAG: hypothetical protein ACK41Q_04210 [Candidatus Brocadia sp.]
MWKCIGVVGLMACATFGSVFADGQAGKPSKEEFAQKAQKIQMPFIANEGQTDERVKYYAKTLGGTVYVTEEGGVVYLLPKRGADKKRGLHSGNASSLRPETGHRLRTETHTQESSGVALKEALVGGKTGEISGEKRSETVVSYFKGNDPSRWKTRIPTYEMVRLGEVYKGIELKLKAHGDGGVAG